MLTCLRILAHVLSISKWMVSHDPLFMAGCSTKMLGYFARIQVTRKKDNNYRPRKVPCGGGLWFQLPPRVGDSKMWDFSNQRSGYFILFQAKCPEDVEGTEGGRAGLVNQNESEKRVTKIK